MATIVIVDDAAFMRVMLKDVVAEAGHRVIGEGETGHQAVKLYAALKPDLITLDMVMSVKTGVEAAQEILAADPRARIVMVSSVGQEEVVQQVLKLGVKAYLLKPFQAERVKACLAKVLDDRASR